MGNSSDTLIIVSVGLTLLLLVAVLLLVLSGVANVVLLRIKQNLQHDLNERLNETKIYEELISLQGLPLADYSTEKNMAYGVAAKTPGLMPTQK